MQPYFLPYIGYFQLMQHCDIFVIYDDIQYSKGGWINRNRMLFEGAPRTFTIPLKRGSDYLDIRDRTISPAFEPDQMMNLFRRAYSKAPYWDRHAELVRAILEFPSRNLFEFVANSITEVAACLDITTKVIVSSQLVIDRSLRGQDRVLATCEVLGATEYINPIGGLDLYSKTAFGERGIRLGFLESTFPPYLQFSETFVEALSIVDVVTFVEMSTVITRLQSDHTIDSA
jgi:hypothetical protein